MSFDALFAAPADGHLHRERDGVRIPLGHRRWLGAADAVDEAIAAAARAPVLDVGCGPGRLLDALVLHGKPALGVDLSPAAVALARSRGHAVQLGSVFDRVHGGFATALLLDGSIGIGGDPAALLQRVRGLADEAIVEVGAPGSGTGAGRVRIEAGGVRSGWFEWAHVDTEGVAALGGLRDLRRLGDRWFAWLA